MTGYHGNGKEQGRSGRMNSQEAYRCTTRILGLLTVCTSHFNYSSQLLYSMLAIVISVNSFESPERTRDGY